MIAPNREEGTPLCTVICNEAGSREDLCGTGEQDWVLH